MTIYHKNAKIDRENKKLNKNVYDMLRSLLGNTCLQITNQKLHQSKLPLFCQFNFQKKDI